MSIVVTDTKGLVGGNLNEVYQDSKICWSLAVRDGDVYERTMPFVKCRDFLNDYFVNVLGQKNSFQIHGFRSPPANQKLRKLPYLLVGGLETKKIESLVERVNKKLNKYGL